MALFAEDQLCFSFLMCCRIMQMQQGCLLPEGPAPEPLPAEEWHTFLHTPVLASMLSGALTRERPSHSLWLTASMWTQCQYLSTQLTVFSGLCRSMHANPGQWGAFHQADDLYVFLGQPYVPLGSTSPPPGMSLTGAFGTSLFFEVFCCLLTDIGLDHFHNWMRYFA